MPKPDFDICFAEAITTTLIQHKEKESRKPFNSHGVAFDFDLCESVFLRQKKTDEQWHIVTDAHRLERSESLAISFHNLKQRAQDNPTVTRTNYCTNLATNLVT